MCLLSSKTDNITHTCRVNVLLISAEGKYKMKHDYSFFSFCVTSSIPELHYWIFIWYWHTCDKLMSAFPKDSDVNVSEELLVHSGIRLVTCSPQ